MNPVSVRENYSTNVFEDFGILVEEFDESANYEHHATRLYNNNGVYTLLSANGCSCWSGEWEGWTNLSLDEVRKLGVSWSNDTGAEKVMGEWIRDNL